jgi:hypothetical protein
MRNGIRTVSMGGKFVSRPDPRHEVMINGVNHTMFGRTGRRRGSKGYRKLSL